jgi:hypothetical protein
VRSRGIFLALRRPLCLERLLCLAQPLAPIARRAQPLGQLVTAGLAVELVLGGVDPALLLEDLPCDLLVAAVRVMGRSGGDLRAVDRDDPDPHEPRPRTQREHAREQP